MQLREGRARQRTGVADTQKVKVKFTQRMKRPNAWRCAQQAILLTGLMAVGHQLLAQQSGQPPSQASQAPATSPQAQPATSQSPTTPANDAGAAKGPPAPDPNVPQNDRILWTLPNFLTVENASSMPPLSAGQKFKLVAQGTFDPWELAFIGAESGVNQAANTNPTFGQGLKGYAKRYGLTFADDTVENFAVGAVFPSLLHQDPRFYQMGKGKFLHRFAYAGLRVLITRSDSGKTQFNFSEIFGAAMSAGISNAYHPRPRTLGSALSIWGTQVGWDAVGYELKEFWPDLHRYLLRGKHTNM